MSEELRMYHPAPTVITFQVDLFEGGWRATRFFDDGDAYVGTSRESAALAIVDCLTRWPL